jgi:hypothetical protein
MPELYIITGSNGAGKSTVGPDYLPEHIQQHPVFGGDKLFMEKRSEFIIPPAGCIELNACCSGREADAVRSL